MAKSPASGRKETHTERADRNLGELLQELRVALPGVQVLFAFLLTVPFSQSFDRLTDGQRDLYFGVLLCTALSTALLIAPTTLHRLLFRMQDKEYLVVIANRYAIAGIAILAIAICGAIFLISDILYGTMTTVIATAGVAAVFLVFWYALPLYRRRKVSDQLETD